MIVAIDSGGTKTKIILSKPDGTVVDTKTIKGFGTAIDSKDEPISPLSDTLLEMSKGCEVTHVTVNLGGKNTSQITNCIRSAFANADIKVFRESSGVIGDYIRETVGADIIFFCGTGSIALAKSEKGCFVLDGWGKEFGDFGSGYDIGLTAVQNSLMELEGQKPLSMLAKEITGQEEPFPLFDGYDAIMKKRDDVRQRIMPAERAKVAAITKIVYQCAMCNDAAAKCIFEIAGEKLGKTAIRAIQKIQKSESVTIAFCGGIAKTKEFWLGSFHQKIKETDIKCKVVFPDIDLASGALAYTINERTKT